MPLLNLGSYTRAPYERVPDVDSPSDDDDSVLDIDDGPKGKRKRWWMYLPLLLLLVLMFAPHYSILVLLVSYYLNIHDSPFLFSLHLFVIYLITFLASCSLLICVVRDPGAIRVGEDATSHSDTQEERESEIEETDMMDILRMNPSSKAKRGTPEVFDDDFNAPHKWCKKCWAPKPERTHHCSACGRCVLKMDHHCPWLAQKCVGHWTYTAFLHFLCCVTLLSVYVGFLAGRIVYVAFVDPFLVNERTALHALFLTMYGAIFSLVVGSFFFWHAYLASTNQTTIENISPFLLLRYLPKLPTAPTALPVNEDRTPSPTGNSVSLNSPFPPRPLSLHSVSVSEPNTPPTNRSSTPIPLSNDQPILARNRSTGSELSSVPPSSGLGLGPSPNAIPTPREFQLTSSQRRAVRSAHSRIRLYDIGLRGNWAQLIGIGGVDNINRNRTSGSARWRWWKGVMYRILCGGGGVGDGKKWPRNPRAEGMLLRLARELASEDKVD